MFLLQGIERWLERQDGRPELLRQVLTLLVDHDKAQASDRDDALRADYLQAALPAESTLKVGASLALEGKQRSNSPGMDGAVCLAAEVGDRPGSSAWSGSKPILWDQSLPLPEPLHRARFWMLITEDLPLAQPQT